MKNGRNRTALVLQLVSWACVLLFAAGVLIYGASTGFGLSDLVLKPEETTEDKQVYVYEETPRSLREVKVDWLDGPVTVKFHSGDTIRVTETAGRALREDEKLLMELSDGELNVHWNSSLLNTDVFRDASKSLEILLPRAFFEKLEKVRIYTVSGDVLLETLEAADVDVETVSGVLTLKNIQAETFRAGSTSGNILCENIAGTEEIRVHTTSGSVQLAALSGGEIQVDSTSGAVVLDCAADILECTTVSGPVDCTLKRWPESLEAKSVGANLDFTVPESKAGFIGKFTTVSGSFDSEFTVEKRNKLYLYGEGKTAVQFSTTSGDVMLHKAAE